MKTHATSNTTPLRSFLNFPGATTMNINEILKPLGTFPEQGSKVEPLPESQPISDNTKEDPLAKDKEQPEVEKNAKGKSR